MPESLSELTNVTQLDLSENEIQKFPEFLSKLTNLIQLDLSDNEIQKFPESLSELTNLTQLNLSENAIQKFPESLSELTNLTQLNLSYNSIKEFPESLSELTNLTQLNLSYNNIKEFPESLSELTNLIVLDLNGNAIENPPLEITNEGIKSIRDYFRQLAEGEDQIYEAKLIIVGEGGAGKTTLAKKLEDPDYQLQQNEPTTEGIDVITWKFPIPEKDRYFQVNIWDFGGQEIYHATHQFFLTKRSLYALVADTRKEDTDFYYWLNVVELLTDNSPVLIVKNEKQDRHREININALRGQFSNLKETLATNLSNNRGLPQIITNIQNYIKQLPHIGQTLPKTWIQVRAALEQDNRNYISLQEYLDICQTNGFTKHSDKLQLSQYLHDLGVCLHFQDKEDSILYKTVILKPKWGTDAVYAVLDNKQVTRNQGCFTREELKDIWHEEKYAPMRGELLELMKKFQLCYEIPSCPDTFISPQLLSENQPEYDWNETNNLILRYAYPDFMPKGIISRFIVAMHQYIEQQDYVWKSGVILRQGNTRAEIIENYGKREIRVRVVGENKRNLMTVITYEIDKLNDSFKRLKYKKLVPCNCQVCQPSNNPYAYEFKQLRERYANDKLTIECGRPPYQEVQVLDLIDNAIDIKKLFHQNQQGRDRIFEADIERYRENTLDQSNTVTRKILILESNPKGTDQLRLNQEIRDIEAALRNSTEGSDFTVKPQLALRIEDLQPSILREKPRFVHFCGHGTGSQGLVVGNAIGETQFVNTSALANLFKQFSDQIECVILNACYTESQTKEIHQHINYVIGTTNAISDSVAILFSIGFYGALGEGKSIEEAYQLGCNRIELGIDVNNHPERKLVPVESENEFKYLDLSNNLVITLLKKEPLNRIVSDEPNEQELKALLNQLKSVILKEDLEDDEKEEALEQIQKIEESLQNSQDRTVKKTAKRAVRLLRVIAADLPPSAAMLTICNQLPDLINKIFG